MGPAPWFVPIAATSSSARRRAAVVGADPARHLRLVVEGQERDDRQRRDRRDRLDGDDELVEVEERLDHEEVDAPSFEYLRLLCVERAVLGRGEDLELPERADRARDEDVPSRHFARLACEAHAGRVDLLERVVEQQPRQLAPVRPEGVRLDQLRARGDVPRVHRRRRSRVRGDSPPPGTAGRRRRRRAALPSRRPRRSGDRSGGARGTGSRLATVPAWPKQGRRQAPLQTNEWLPRKWEPAPPRARRVRWPVRTIGATRPLHPSPGWVIRDARRVNAGVRTRPRPPARVCLQSDTRSSQRIRKRAAVAARVPLRWPRNDCRQFPTRDSSLIGRWEQDLRVSRPGAGRGLPSRRRP